MLNGSRQQYSLLSGVGFLPTIIQVVAYAHSGVGIMKLQAILRVKGTAVFTVEPGVWLAVVVEWLVKCNCGSLVVCDDGQMVGIITERDILKACAGDTTTLEGNTVAERMTTDVITGSLTDEVETIMGLMTKNRIRHMPILENGELAGMISIGDVVKAQHAELSMENHYLKEYIQS